jgi:hypothetical protein
VTLANEEDRQKTSEGVEIWIEQKPGNEIRPMASIPEGTLEIYKYCRPVMIHIDWVWPEAEAVSK